MTTKEITLFGVIFAIIGIPALVWGIKAAFGTILILIGTLFIGFLIKLCSDDY